MAGFFVVGPLSGPDGQRMVRMWIRDEVNAGLSDGSFDRSMRDSFGVRRRGY